MAGMSLRMLALPPTWGCSKPWTIDVTNRKYRAD